MSGPDTSPVLFLGAEGIWSQTPDGKQTQNHMNYQPVSFSNINLQSHERTPWFSASFGFKQACKRTEQSSQQSLSGHTVCAAKQTAQALNGTPLKELQKTSVPLVPGEKLPSTLIIMQYCGFSSACQAFYRTLASLCYESWLAQTIVSGFLTCFVLLDPAGRCFLVQWKGGSVDVEQVRKRGLKVILICL